MSAGLRFLLLGFALFTFAYFLLKIRKNRLQIDYAVFWSLFGVGLMLISIFPGIVVWVSKLLGFQSPANLVLLSVIFVVILRLFSISCNQSRMYHQIAELTHRIALYEKQLQDVSSPSIEDFSSPDEDSSVR